MQFDYLLVVLLSALSSASVLVIVTLGLAVIFGLMGVVNLAHGEFIMFGAYAALARELGMPLDFPSTQGAYDSIVQVTTTPLLARGMAWMSTGSGSGAYSRLTGPAGSSQSRLILSAAFSDRSPVAPTTCVSPIARATSTPR